MASPKTESVAASRWFWICTGVLVALFVGIMVYVQMSKDAPQETYKGFPVSRAPCPGSDVDCAFVSFSIRDEPYTISFYYHPEDVASIPVAPDAVRTVYKFQGVKGGQAFIAVPDGSPGKIGIAAVEIARLLGQRYKIFNFNARGAVIGSGEGQVSCATADNTTLVVLFEQGPVTAAHLQAPNCVVLSALDDEDAVRVADAFSFMLLGVTAVIE